MASWSWIYNIVKLKENFRIYTVDLIGEPGRSTLFKNTNFPDTNQEICQYYSEILDVLKIDKAIIIGLGVGGYQGIRYAQQQPDRVEKLVLIGPRGFIPAIDTYLEECWVQYFPIKPIIKYNGCLGSMIIQRTCILNDFKIYFVPTLMAEQQYRLILNLKLERQKLNKHCVMSYLIKLQVVTFFQYFN